MSGANGYDHEAVAPLKLVWFEALDEAVQQQQLVKDLLIAGTLCVIYGESNSGKTFFVLDLALAIAHGAVRSPAR